MSKKGCVLSVKKMTKKLKSVRVELFSAKRNSNLAQLEILEN